MKNRILILTDLIKMKEANISLDEMIKNLEHNGLSYYESINILNEVTHVSLEKLSDTMLREQYWKIMKNKTDEKEGIVQNEYDSIMSMKVNNHNKLDENIKEAYQHLVNNKKEQEKKLKNLDKTLTEIFIK